MSAAKPPIRFLFDYLSPYAYLAWTQIHALAARHDRDIEPVPVLFAALLGHWGTKGPAEIPPKRAYVLKDTLRTARALGVTLLAPPEHPFNSLLALRVSSLPMGASTRRLLIDGLFAATWSERKSVAEPRIVASVATAAGLDGENALQAASLPDAKARLRAATDDAIARGVFGVPTMLADGELFWGLDSFAHLERRLRGEDTVDDAAVAAWDSVPVGAVRARR